MRLRHHHLKVIRAWKRAVEAASTDETRAEARRHWADAWARLAHWSGLAEDRAEAARAKAIALRPKRSASAPRPKRSAAAPRPKRSAMLTSIVEDLRRTYPELGDSSVPEPSPLVIVIDPGHGGRDRGATGVGKVREKTINLTLAQRLGRALERQLGAKVVFTRTRDRYVSLRDRVRFANRAKADLFISIHANAHRRSSAHGVETYFVRGARRMGSKSWRLARLVQNSTIRSLRRVDPGVKNLGSKPAGFRVLRGVKMPAVLVESGFLTHRGESERLRKPFYQRRLVSGIVSGVERFVKEALKPKMKSVAELSGRSADLMKGVSISG